MMRQSETFTPHTSISANGGVDTEPTDLDLVEVFESSGKNAIMKLGDKKKFMIRIFNNSKDFIEKAIILDTAINSTLTKTLKRILPKSKTSISNGSNNELSKKLVELRNGFNLLHLDLEEQEKSLTAATERLRNRLEPRKKSNILILLEEYSELMKTAVSNAKVNILNSTKNPYSSGITLTRQQREQTFNFVRIPKDESYRECLFCGHSSVNEPEENEQVVERNKELKNEYENKLKTWS